MKILLRLTLLFLAAGLSNGRLAGQTIGADGEFDGEVLTRGPVHEAFAGVVNYNPEAGLIVDRPPPEPIEELPPEERPADADTAWIPGYWGWDDERGDFIWISGTWRVLPPGRAWIAGYWRDTGRGWQWVSGYWADAGRQEVTYLAPPPETLEQGPSSPAPASDYEWVPGCWEWREGRYLWRTGYWIEGQADWVWVPSYYIWTPRGYVFIEGYWDYAPAERGLLFAPVYYREVRPRIRYQPAIVLNVAILADYLFLRPRYSHYYFGDYYDARYETGGFFAAFTFQTSRRGYDPFYSYGRWRHRDDRDWDRRYRESYDYRREHVDARPPRTWSGSTLSVNVNIANTQIGGGGRSRSVMYAQPIQQYARTADAPVRIERTPVTESRQQLQRAAQVQAQREQRRTVESQQTAGMTAAPYAPASGPAGSERVSGSGRPRSVSAQELGRAALPSSPIVARETSGGRQPPPRAARPEPGARGRESERAAPRGAIGAPAEPVSPGQSRRSDNYAPRETGRDSVIGAPPQPAPRPESSRQFERNETPVGVSSAADAQRQQEEARQEQWRQSRENDRRSYSPARGQIGAEPTRRSDVPVQPVRPPEAVSPGQAHERGYERRAEEERARASGQQADREEQQRREQERALQPRAQFEQVPPGQPAVPPEQARAPQAQAPQSGAAAQAQSRAYEAQAAQQAHAQQEQAREQQRQQVSAQQQQAREQQQQARDQQQQAREQQAQASEQARQQQAQAADQARQPQAQDQQARAAQAAEAARQKGAANRPQAQPPSAAKKTPPPQDQSDDEDERKKRKG